MYSLFKRHITTTTNTFDLFLEQNVVPVRKADGRRNLKVGPRLNFQTPEMN